MQLASSNSIYVFKYLKFSTSFSIVNTSYVKAPWYDDSRSNQGSISLVLRTFKALSMLLPVFRVITGALLMETLVRRGWKEDKLPKLRSICLTLAGG